MGEVKKMKMYSVITIAAKYIKYYLTALNGKGHGIHSPFVFDLVKHVLNDKTRYDFYDKIERVRKVLLSDERVITVIDYGAGSGSTRSNLRAVKSIASTSLKPAKYARLMFRLVKYYKPGLILELGTSLGLTTAYLATGNTGSRVITCEGDPSIASVAKSNLEKLSITNTEIYVDEFTNSLPVILAKNKVVDFVFIDGNHKKQPTLDYFDLLKKNINADTVMVFDDIHWSSEMEEAWENIKQDSNVTLTVDLFFLGLVFFRSGFHQKQHFIIRF